jgi:hypothetical protein
MQRHEPEEATPARGGLHHGGPGRRLGRHCRSLLGEAHQAARQHHTDDGPVGIAERRLPRDPAREPHRDGKKRRPLHPSHRTVETGRVGLTGVARGGAGRASCQPPSRVQGKAPRRAAASTGNRSAARGARRRPRPATISKQRAERDRRERVGEAKTPRAHDAAQGRLPERVRSAPGRSRHGDEEGKHQERDRPGPWIRVLRQRRRDVRGHHRKQNDGGLTQERVSRRREQSAKNCVTGRRASRQESTNGDSASVGVTIFGFCAAMKRVAAVPDDSSRANKKGGRL